MRCGIAVTLLLCICLPAAAQVAAEQQGFERTLEQFRRETRYQNGQSASLGEQALLQYGAYIEADYFSLDDRNHDNHGGREYSITGYGRLNFYDAHEFFVRARFDYRNFNPGDSFNGKQDQQVQPWLDRAYYRFDLAKQIARDQGRLPDWDLSLKGGRDLAYWANGLVVSEVLDGGVVDFSSGPISIEGIGGITIGHTVDFDTSRRHFDNDTHRGFFGGLLQGQIAQQHPFVYGVVERDYNDDISRLNIGGAGGAMMPITTRYDYNANYIGIGSTGALSDKLQYGLELVYEGGTNLSNSYAVRSGAITAIPQTLDDLRAYAGDLRVDFLPGDVYKTRLSAEMLVSSGDSDRIISTNTFGGNRPHTPDLAFNTVGLVDTGLAFAPAISNLTMIRLGFSSFPAPHVDYLRRFQIGSDFFLYLKSDVRAPIDEPTQSNKRFLGVEPDFFINWRLTSDVTFTGRYGIFFPGETIQSGHGIRQFVFVGVNIAF